MVDLFTGVFYGIAALQLLLVMLATYYAYRIGRLIGSFRAWSLLILSFVLTLGQNLLGLSTLIQMPEDKIVALFNQSSSTVIWTGQILSMLPSILLTISMYGLHQIFKKKAATRSVEQMPADIQTC